MDGTPVLDVDNGQVYCDGRWNAPNKAGQLKAAIENVHKAHNHTGPYLRQCSACVAFAASSQSGTESPPCAIHAGIYPRLSRTGNPAEHTIFTNTVKQTKKDGAAYCERGDSQLLPSDLRNLRTYLLSTNDVSDLQMWVVVLLGCKLFLRPDEVLHIKMSGIMPELIVRDEGDVRSIMLEVMGKADKKPVHLVAWSDYDYPDLCLIRALLVYLHVTGIQGGFLFPPLPGLSKGNARRCVGWKNKVTTPKDDVFNMSVEYASFHKQFKAVASTAIHTPELKLGLHCLRKTGYLLAVWGDGDPSEVKHSARHSTVKNAETYRKDAMLLREDARIQKSKNNGVSKWKPCRREAITQAARLHLRPASGNLSLPDVAGIYIRESLGFSSDSPYNKSPSILLDAAVQHQRKQVEEPAEFEKSLRLGAEEKKTCPLGARPPPP